MATPSIVRAALVAAVGWHTAAQAQPAATPAAAFALDAAESDCATGATNALSAFRPLPSRSPSGLLYQRPPAMATPRDTGGWTTRGCVQLGVVVGDTDEASALFGRYRDLEGGATLDAFSFIAEANASFVEVGGGRLGRDDQQVGLRAGRVNDFSLAAYYRETPQVFSDRFRSLWSGVGSAELTLADAALAPGGLADAGATQAALRDVLAATPPSALQIIRREGGLSLEARLSESWRAFLSLASERRRGARPLGAVFGGGDGGGNVDVPQSVDDASHEISAGAAYADALTSVNLRLSASLYRNRVDTMRFANPLTIAPSGIEGIAASEFTHGRFALDPDNDYTNARLDVARVFPGALATRVTATLSLGRLRQNEPLLAPTALPLAGATINGVPADGQWNTAAALTRTHAGARIDTRLAVVTASIRPARNLALTARYRDDDTDNDTEYQACNPQTGQLGRLLNDGSGAALVEVPQYLAARCDLAAIRALGITPDAGDITLAGAPFEQRRRTYGLRSDWRLRAGTNLTLEVEREDIRRRWRERDRTTEDRLKLVVVERRLAAVVLRGSVEYAERGGSDDRSATVARSELRSASLGPLPASGNVSTWFGSVDDLRKFDLADREQATVRLRADFTLGDGFDAGIHYGGTYTRYPDARIGRSGSEARNSVGIDLNYVAAGGLSLHGFYTFQNSRLRQAGVQPAGCLIGFGGVTAENFEQCGALGGPLFPRDRLWEAESRDRNHVVGAGGRADFSWGVVDFDYTYSQARTSIDYAYGSGIFLSPERQALAGNGWPDLRFRQSGFAVSAWIPVKPRVSLRLRLQIESGEIDDWHYDGVTDNPVPLANTIYLTGAPRRYRAVFGGLLLRIAL